MKPLSDDPSMDADSLVEARRAFVQAKLAWRALGFRGLSTKPSRYFLPAFCFRYSSVNCRR